MKKGDIAFKFELGLPHTASLATAERDLLNACRCAGIPSSAVVQRSGQKLFYAFGGYRIWDNVSPASDAWRKNGKASH